MALDEGARQNRRRRPPPRACGHLPEPCFQREAIAAYDLIHLGKATAARDHARMGRGKDGLDGCGKNRWRWEDVWVAKLIIAEVAFRRRHNM